MTYQKSKVTFIILDMVYKKDENFILSLWSELEESSNKSIALPICLSSKCFLSSNKWNGSGSGRENLNLWLFDLERVLQPVKQCSN